MNAITFHPSILFLFRYKIRIGDTNHASKLGDRNAIFLDILTQTIHPKYNGMASYYDVAVLETSPVTFTKLISPICLPQLPSDNIYEYDNDFVDLIGWSQENLNGETSNKLKRVSLKIHTLRYYYKGYSFL